MKPKLLVTASTFPRWAGDTEPRFILDLSKSLLPFFEVTVLAPACPGAKKYEILEGIKVIRYHYFPVHNFETLCYPGAIVPRIKEKKWRILLVPFLFLGLWFSLFRLLPKYDIVHAHWLIPQGIVQSFFKKKYIITGHGGDVTSLNIPLIKNLKIHALKKAERITVVSHALEKYIVDFIGDRNIFVQPMGCDLSMFGAENRVENYFDQGDKKVVLFVGRLAEKKGVSYLIEAVKNIDVKLIIVGEGPLEKQLKRQAESQRNKISFLGGKTHEELKKIYASADIFVAPSITAKDGDKEGVPTTIMEAMASGLPVIASDSSGIPEVVSDGENGFLTEEKNVEDIAKKITLLIENADLYKRLKNGAINDSKDFDYNIIGEKYANIIRECLKD